MTEKPGRELDHKILEATKAKLPELEQLLEDVNGDWTYVDGIYRFFHGSFKVYSLQNSTVRIVEMLKSVMPDRDLNSMFMEIVNEGTRLVWEHKHNATWTKTTRPIVEAFFHARFFLEMGIKCAKEMESAEAMLPSSWAAFLYLYNAR